MPSGITEVERRAVRDSAETAGAKQVLMVAEPMAAAIGVGLPVETPTGNMVIDIGGGTTEIAVIALSGIVCDTSIRTGGDELDQAIVQFMRKNYNLLVGEPTAEAIKIKIGSAAPTGDEREMEVKGRDLVSGIPKTVRVHSTEIREAVQEPIQQIVDAVRRALEITPPELASDIVDRGIVMTGGGALIRGLDLLLAQETGLPIHVDEDPLTCVVRGTGRILDDYEKYRSVLSVLSMASTSERSLHPPGHRDIPRSVSASRCVASSRPTGGATSIADTLRRTVLSPLVWLQARAEEGRTSRVRFRSHHRPARFRCLPRPVPSLASGGERAASAAPHAQPPTLGPLRRRRGAAPAAGHRRPDPAAERGLARGRRAVRSGGGAGGADRDGAQRRRRTSSVAMTWAHPEFRVSAFTVSGNALGVVAPSPTTGTAKGALEFRGVPYRDSVPLGTLVLSSGLGGVYPEGNSGGHGDRHRAGSRPAGSGSTGCGPPPIRAPPHTCWCWWARRATDLAHAFPSGFAAGGHAAGFDRPGAAGRLSCSGRQSSRAARRDSLHRQLAHDGVGLRPPTS